MEEDAGEEFDIDSIKDDQNPQYQSLQIYRQRLISIMDSALEKCAIAYCLEEMFNHNGAILKKIVRPFDLAQILEMYIKRHQIALENQLSSTPQKNHKSRFKVAKSVLSSDSKQEEMLSLLLTKLHSNKDVILLAKRLLHQKNMKDIDFYLLMKDLRNYAFKALHRTATEENNYQKQLANAWINNIKYKQKNEELSVLHQSKMQDLLNQLKEKHAIVEKQEEVKNLMYVKCMEDINKIIHDSEFNMENVSQDSALTVLYLTDEAKKTTQQYQQLLESHLAQEKALRVKRYKIETQLATWLGKYDTEIGELNGEYEVLKDGFDKEEEEYIKLQEMFAEQNEIYIPLMEEKAEEDERLWQIKYYDFMKKRSARRIQAWWRAILARRRGRRRKKKKK